jgi:hypothetical protein
LPVDEFILTAINASNNWEIFANNFWKTEVSGARKAEAMSLPSNLSSNACRMIRMGRYAAARRLPQ